MIGHYRRDSDGFLGVVNKYWPLVVALISVIVMITTIKNKVDDHEARLSRVEISMTMIQSDTSRLVHELLDRK